MLGRILSLFTALMLACAPASAYAPERSLAAPELRASPAKTASRGFAAEAKQAAKKKSAAIVCRVWEIWSPPRKLASSMGFTGYYADAESGDYYAQQRYYRQGIGRFLSVDPWEGDPNSPITLNKYLYANGNPLVYVDPDGRCGVMSSVPSLSAICAPVEAKILGIDLGTEAGWRQLAEYRRGTRQGAWESAKETAAGLFQFAADLSVSGRERLTGENFGASERLGATVGGMVETISDPSGSLATYAADRKEAIAAARASEDFEELGNYVSRTQIEVGSGLTGAAGAARTAVVTSGRLAGRLAPDVDGTKAVTLSEAPDGTHIAPVSKVPESYMNPEHIVDMEPARSLSGSTLNALGEVRNANFFWRELLARNPDMFSKGNRYKIEELGLSPKVDRTWADHNPAHESFMRDVLHHHHIDRGRNAVPLPKTVHDKWSTELHGGRGQ